MTAAAHLRERDANSTKAQLACVAPPGITLSLRAIAVHKAWLIRTAVDDPRQGHGEVGLSKDPRGSAAPDDKSHSTPAGRGPEKDRPNDICASEIR